MHNYLCGDVLIIFAKEPELGRVKTRLARDLSDERCAELYRAFLRDTVALANMVKCEKILAYESSKEPVFLKKIAPRCRFYKQRGRDLGERMRNAFKFANAEGAERMVLIGSDTPSLPIDFIERAFKVLDNNDVVIGPSSDGGYYLIGIRKPCAGLFEGVEWSSDKVFESTMENARGAGKRAAVLEQWFDVDTLDDLVRLKKELELDKKTARWTREILKKKLSSQEWI